MWMSRHRMSLSLRMKFRQAMQLKSIQLWSPMSIRCWWIQLWNPVSIH
jgi:hypothetical protein